MQNEPIKTFDNTDIAVLYVWQEPPRYEGIARTVGITEERVFESMHKWRQAGIMHPQTGHLQYEALGCPFRAMLTITVNPWKAATLVQRLSALDHILSLRRLQDETVMRHSHVYLAEAVASSRSELSMSLSGVLFEINEYVVIRFQVVEEVVKTNSIVPLMLDTATAKPLIILPAVSNAFMDQ